MLPPNSPLAQLVEHGADNAVVPSSTLGGATKIYGVGRLAVTPEDIDNNVYGYIGGGTPVFAD